MLPLCWAITFLFCYLGAVLTLAGSQGWVQNSNLSKLHFLSSKNRPRFEPRSSGVAGFTSAKNLRLTMPTGFIFVLTFTPPYFHPSHSIKLNHDWHRMTLIRCTVWLIGLKHLYTLQLRNRLGLRLLGAKKIASRLQHLEIDFTLLSFDWSF